MAETKYWTPDAIIQQGVGQIKHLNIILFNCYNTEWHNNQYFNYQIKTKGYKKRENNKNVSQYKSKQQYTFCSLSVVKNGKIV
jgi:hypothetical protein